MDSATRRDPCVVLTRASRVQRAEIRNSPSTTLLVAHDRCSTTTMATSSSSHTASPTAAAQPRAHKRALLRWGSVALGATLSVGVLALGSPAHAAPRPVVKAPPTVVSQIADVLDVEARCIKVQLARSWRAWAWVAPTYRMGCERQLDTAVIFAKQSDSSWANTGIEGAPLVCSTLKREMSLYVEDNGANVGKRTMRAFRDFKAQGICVKG